MFKNLKIGTKIKGGFLIIVILTGILGYLSIRELSQVAEPIEKDIFHLSDEEKKEFGIESLPGSLAKAIEITEKSEVVRKALGNHIFNNFITSKKVEWDEYRTKVHPYETERYLAVL